MKKLFLILINILFSIVVWSQDFETFGNISEIETSGNVNIYIDNCMDLVKFVSLEDHLLNFEMRYGLNKLQSLLNNIENNTDSIYVSKLKNRSEATYAHHLRLIITNNKISFIYKGKIYVLTYEPTNRKKSCGGKESHVTLIPERKLYLYCKSGHVWIKVSGEIDRHIKTSNFMKELTPGRKPSPDNPQSSRPIINFKEKPITLQYYVTKCNISKNGKEKYNKELSIIKLYDKNSTLYTDDKK